MLLTAWFAVLAGCASAPRADPALRSAELLSERSSGPGRICEVVDRPERLPAADALVDSAALRADIVALLQASEDSTGYVLFSMAFDKHGTNIRRAVIEHDVRPVLADSLQKLVFKHRRTVEESDGDWGVRLRIGLAESPRFDVGRQERCAPRPRDGSLARAIETASLYGTGTRYRGGVRETTVWVRLQIGPSGNVTGAAIERGIVGGTAVEQRIYDFVRTLFFDPALEDGFPTTGYLSIPLVVRG